MRAVAGHHGFARQISGFAGSRVSGVNPE